MTLTESTTSAEAPSVGAWRTEPRVPELDIPATIPALIRWATETHGDRDLIATASGSSTFAEIDQASRRMAKRLLAQGVGKGTRVGMLFPQGPEWVVAFFAAARIGALVMPFSSMYRPAELARTLRQGDVSHLVVPATMFGRDMEAFVAEAVPGLAVTDGQQILTADAPHLRSVLVHGADTTAAWAVPLLGEEGPVVDDDLLAAVEQAVTPADLLVTIYTSGTTSEPKGVVHSHGTQVRHSAQMARMTMMSPRDKIFAGMPFFWVGGLTTTLLPAMHAGSAVLSQERFEAGGALDLLEGQAATRIIAWPTLRQRLQAHPSFGSRDLSSVAAFPATGERRHSSLGMTETAGPHTLAGGAELIRTLGEDLAGSFGPAVPFVEHRIADPVTNATLPPGEVGEICVRGYSLMQGIYKQEREVTFDADGWYHTGDRGYFKEGFLFFEGRASEMIKSAGSNVSPREVETEMESLPEIESAWVFGMPDPERGELVVAAVLAVADVDVAAVSATLSERLSSYKVPREIVVLSEQEVPLLATGKADRLAVKKVVQAKVAERRSTH